MGRLCSADVILDAGITAIRQVLERCSELGIKYDNRDNIYSNIDYPWSVDEASEFIIKAMDKNNEYYFLKRPFLTFDYKKKSCAISFNLYKDRISFAISPAGNYCYKGNPDKRRLDFSWYIELLLNVCRDFAVLEISTYDEYFNE